ncbi:hypothetical protein Poli38472_009245 [Pythium oligandrum]|uniref:NADAR domain-containing protein n=1 Tax=Pythium oligandrum TaxID=41045 RepID=A0A8K1CMK9_PYTOL|nr:hypothetical protein Poli38472_009245 [Pythium oligandrum]|eukprot:TMW65078.1 hypothetical protein Poli38472_009245 [Pythium oligandrum]
MATESIETSAAIYFYGQREPRFGYMSNFYPCHFVDAQGQQYRSSEQYFMKKKQELFDPTNQAVAIAILSAKTPPEVKRLGRRVKNYDDKVWAAKRYEVMVEALKLKFTADSDLRVKLLATGNKKLYEASRSDAIWGIGLGIPHVKDLFRRNEAFFAAGDVDDATQSEWYGQNLLGKALMETRAWLWEQELAMTLEN